MEMEQKIRIRDVDLNYVQVGEGEHPILLLPGTMGTIWSNYAAQVENLDRKLFTIVSWDPPGNGNSRPPNRTSFPEDYLQEDATYAKDLMNALGHKTFSMIGWCNGARTASVLAALYPESVRKLVTISANSYILPQEMELYEKSRNIEIWPKGAVQDLSAIYPMDYLKCLWNAWIDWLADVYESKKSHIYTELLDKIVCPTLIVHGKKDFLLNKSHAEFLGEKIANSRVHIFEEGSHNTHIEFSEKFNDLATKFLSSA